MKILSLFDGMSVAQQALKNIGADVEVYYASEIDPYAIATTMSNFPNTVQLGSVLDLLPDVEIQTDHLVIDLMIGGSPCQDLSIAGKRKGLKGERSGLFWEYVRIRNEVKPKYFILENVASMPKEAKDTISEALGVQPVMINASLVSAQNRKRLFWVGKWNGEKYEQVEIPQPEDGGILLKDILEEEVDEKYFMNQEQLDKLCLSNYRDRHPIPSTKDKMGTLKIVGNVKRIVIKEATKKGYATINEGDAIDVSFPNSKTRRGRVGEKAKNIMTSKTIATFINGYVRYLTPKEYLRLQSMPDDYFDKAEYKGKPISNTQRYKMCGNAFNCKVIEHIINNLNDDRK